MPSGTGRSRFTFDSFARISSPAKLHVLQKRQRIPVQQARGGLPSPFVLADGARVALSGVKARGRMQLQRLPPAAAAAAAAAVVPRSPPRASRGSQNDGPEAATKPLMIRGLSGGSPQPLGSNRSSGFAPTGALLGPIVAASEFAAPMGRHSDVSSDSERAPGQLRRHSSMDAVPPGAAMAMAAADADGGGADGEIWPKQQMAAAAAAVEGTRTGAEAISPGPGGGAAEGSASVDDGGGGGGGGGGGASDEAAAALAGVATGGNAPTGAAEEPAAAAGEGETEVGGAAGLLEAAQVAMPTPPALKNGTPLTVQQLSDSALMLLRCDFKAAGAVDGTMTRLTSALRFIAQLAQRSAALGVLQGAIFQALAAWWQQQQQRIEAERRQQEAAAAAAAAAEGAEGGAPAAAAPPPDGSDAVRQTLNSAEGKRDEPSPLLAELGPEATRQMAEAADDLRKLLRVKVADDQDIKTAQQGLAESAYFFLALVQEAEGLGVSADEQLQQYTW